MPFSDRTAVLIGHDGVLALARARACVFGLGGVGAAAAMDLVRAGVGELVVVDFDEVAESNLNRLYFGYTDEVGRPKIEVFSDYARRVNPGVQLEAVGALVRGAEAADRIPEGCDFYLDCIDTLSSKVNLMAALARLGLPFASAMGTAGRLAPERLKVGSLWDASGCPLASDVRKRLRRLGFAPPGVAYAAFGSMGVSLPAAFDCVWSDEPPVPPAPPLGGLKAGDVVDGVRIRAVQGSGPFVPQAAGHIIASLAVRRIVGSDAP